MKIFPLGIVNAFATRTPTKKRRPGRALGATKKATNAVCRVNGADGKPYLKVTIKGRSKYRGIKGNDLVIYLVYSSNKTYIEVHDKKSSGSQKVGGRLKTDTGVTDSIDSIAAKANADATLGLHFVWSVIQKGNDIIFDSGFAGPGARFKNGRGR